MTLLPLWKVEKGKLYVNGSYVPFDYDIGRFKPGPQVYPVRDKLLIVLSTAERNGIRLLEEKPTPGDIDYARNAYCVNGEGKVLWRGEALRMINTYVGFYFLDPSCVRAAFDHEQNCEIDMKTGRLKRDPHHPPAPDQ